MLSAQRTILSAQYSQAAEQAMQPVVCDDMNWILDTEILDFFLQTFNMSQNLSGD